MGFFFRKPQMPTAAQALPGRSQPAFRPPSHFLNHRSLEVVPEGYAQAMFGMGCFWGAEKRFWVLPGVWTTSVGYAGGFTPHPTYEEVCTGRTGHNEVVRVVFDPIQLPYSALLRCFWESHDPTQGFRQGNDVGTQYRSGIYFYGEEQKEAAERSRDSFALRLRAAGFPAVTTEILPAPPYYFAEDYHQQYLAKNPGGYCGLGGTGLSCA